MTTPWYDEKVHEGKLCRRTFDGPFIPVPPEEILGRYLSAREDLVKKQKTITELRLEIMKLQKDLDAKSTGTVA